jgi:hypothetical protein
MTKQGRTRFPPAKMLYRMSEWTDAGYDVSGGKSRSSSASVASETVFM